MKEYNFLAFDLGATSGRAVLGTVSGVKFETREIHRFSNPLVELHGRFYWNIYSLYASLLESLSICAKQNISLDSIGIDTWGVDFGYIAEDGSLLGLPRSYRDPVTEGAPEDFCSKMPKDEVYKKTGLQIMPINSLYQMYRADEASSVFQKIANKILFIPDLLAYMLTGNSVCEYTIASTSQLLNATTKSFDESLLEAVGVSSSQMAPLIMPGTLIGKLSPAIAKKTGIGEVPVIAVAGHDTACAIAAVPSETPHFAYMSSGTWSLMGIEVEKSIINEDSYKNNFTNEGGIEGTIRFLKNITGLWILERCRHEWLKFGWDYSYQEIETMARASKFNSLINPDDPCFANPANMLQEIADYCGRTNQSKPESDADYARCVFVSLANRYREVLEMLKSMSPFKVDQLYIIGGGSQNSLLNQLTADAIGLPVIAGPSEATAIGNCLIQAKAAGLLADRWEMRRLVASTFSLQTYLPRKL